MCEQATTHRSLEEASKSGGSGDSLPGQLIRINLETTTSTNDEARRWFASHPGQLAVISARQQTRGRGRLGRRWISPVGGAWVTLVWPTGDRRPGGGVALAAALAAIDAIDTTLREVHGSDDTPLLRIRWPNDLLLDGHKIGGVLGEWVLADGRGALLLGVGVNVNNDLEKVGEPLRTPGDSISRRAGGPVDLDRFLDLLVGGLVRTIEVFGREGFSADLRYRIETRLADRGDRVRLKAGSEEVEGVLVGLGPAGELVLNVGGRIRSFVSGELSCRGVGSFFP